MAVDDLTRIADAVEHIAMTLEWHFNQRVGDPKYSRTILLLSLDDARKQVIRNINERKDDRSSDAHVDS